MGMTMIEKILAEHSGNEVVKPGQIVDAAVDTVMLHDVGMPGIEGPLAQLGLQRISANVRCVIVPDHFVPAPTVQAAQNLKKTREFARKMGIEDYYEQGRGGICHQVMVEKGHVLPGRIIVAPDSHATTYGALGALGTGFGVTDVAIALGLGRLWFQVPETIKIILEGKLGAYVSAKDVAFYLLKEFGSSRLIYKAIELSGPVIEEMSLDGRMCLANMAFEMGVKACLMPPDEKVMHYLGKFIAAIEPVQADSDANYVEEITMDLSELPPMVALPHHPSNGKPVDEVEGVRVQQAFLGSCTNGRMEDLRLAAAMIRGRSVHPEVRLIVTPASQAIYMKAMEEGILQTLIDAGALVTNPGCGVCLGGHLGLIASGEVCISSSNRNFRGRMGSIDGSVYLGSPATVIASAITGEITDPRKLDRGDRT